MRYNTQGVAVVMFAILVGIAVANWTDDFESYPAGQWPASNWIPDGNRNGVTVTDVQHGGAKSFRLYGVVGDYWATLAHRYMGTDPAYVMEFYIRNGAEDIPSSGHQWRGCIDIHPGPSFTTPGAQIIYWHKNGEIISRGGLVLGTYSTLNWYRVKVLYERDANNVHLEYWIDGELKGEENLAANQNEMQYQYFSLIAQAGTVWYDEVSIATPDVRATVDFDPNLLNLNSRGNWVTCYIELPNGYSVRDIQLATVAISGINGQSVVPPLYREGPIAYGDFDRDGVSDLMVKFDRARLVDILRDFGAKDGDRVELTVTGRLNSGVLIQGSDTIGIIDKGKGGAQAWGVVAPAEVCDEPDMVLSTLGRATLLTYSIPKSASVSIVVRDVAGRAVRTLVDAAQSAGQHRLTWNGTDDGGRRLPSGTYFCTMNSGEFTATRKLAIMD